ncbi:hypothetical protein BDP55DRAFT_123849 [Colletotrichum godetiae]|uniref:Uncharacterized protein n=1 Tax=Colletotrichum godetiae TaxID=1209918 RepID=A0AAJ0EYL1_9PEZI|nr:uncharacterized protein BDP55DRAFT_123849 [Colletotrichum godetiae]KAK1700257.1 hypothetical protein BDP55DRAFT_123849 [Colletotrichum godetiae]
MPLASCQVTFALVLPRTYDQPRWDRRCTSRQPSPCNPLCNPPWARRRPIQQAHLLSAALLDQWLSFCRAMCLHYTPFLPSASAVVAATIGRLVCEKRNQTVWHLGTMPAATSVSVASAAHPLARSPADTSASLAGSGAFLTISCTLTTTRYKTPALVHVTPWQATLTRYSIDFPLDTGTTIQQYLFGTTSSLGSHLLNKSKSQLPSSSASLRFIGPCARSGHRYQNITSQLFDWVVSAVSTWGLMWDLGVLLRYPKSRGPVHVWFPMARVCRFPLAFYSRRNPEEFL